MYILFSLGILKCVLLKDNGMDLMASLDTINHVALFSIASWIAGEKQVYQSSQEAVCSVSRRKGTKLRLEGT